MRKLGKKDLKNLPEGKSKQYVKLYYLDQFPEIFYEGLLDVQVLIKQHNYHGDKKIQQGELLTLALLDMNWAEYTQKDVNPSGDLVVDNHLLRIYENDMQ
jgi:hypothetical protein